MKMEKLDLEKYWRYLVKPHSQWLMLCHLTDTSSYMLPPLFDDVFTRNVHIRLGQPPEVNPMLNILHIKEQMEEETTGQSLNKSSL